jgi:hypothetical protein
VIFITLLFTTYNYILPIIKIEIERKKKMAFPNFATDGDLTNSRPVLQLRVAQVAILDEDEDRFREGRKTKKEYLKPYGSEADKSVRGCVTAEVALKKRRTGKEVLLNDIYDDGKSSFKLPEGLVPHFSHLNQLPIQISDTDFNKLAPEEKKALIESHFQIGGIVGTSVEPNYEGKNYGKNDFVVEIGGVRSLINNNPKKQILQGQLVLARAPLPGQTPKAPAGTDPKKVLVQLEPFDPNCVVSRDTIEYYLNLDPAVFNERFINNNGFQNRYLEPGAFFGAFISFYLRMKQGNQKFATQKDREDNINLLKATVQQDLKEICLENDPADPNHPKVNKETMEFMNAFHQINHHVQSMVVGVAMSDAPPGGRFDIKFGSYAI